MVDKKRKIRRFTYRGKELEELLDMKEDNLLEMMPSRIRRKLKRSNGFNGKYKKLLERIVASKKNL